MKNILITALVAIVVSLGTVYFIGKTPVEGSGTEDAYARVMRTKTLRCAYYIWPPFGDRNINTGEMDGVDIDYTEALGKRYGLKIEWTLELVSGSEVDQLKSGAADAICTGATFNPALTQYLFFTQPIFYDPASVFVRVDNKKVATGDDLNRPEIIFTAIEGDLSHDLASHIFPLATMKALPGSASPGQMLEDLRTGKADAVVLENLTMQKLGPQYALDFRRVNPGDAAYLGLYAFGFGVLPADTRLMQMLNQMIEDMRNMGVEVRAHEPWHRKFPGGIIPVRDFRTLEKTR